ncbi:hypothetical protein ACN47E_009621 [Coniothyrium glycines]
MSSITTAIPSGPANTPGLGPNYTGNKWCIQGLVDIFESDTPPYTYNECANSTLSEQKSDFQTLCCDGTIIDTTYNLWGRRNISDYQLDMANLVCCRAGGQRIRGGLSPIDTDATHCSASSVSAPLASLAATNTANAALYTVIYESASEDAHGEVGDWMRTETPTCLWVQTAGAQTNVPLVTVTVPAAQITTLPPPTTDRFGNTILSTAGTGMGSGVRSGSGVVRSTASATTGAPASASQSTSDAAMTLRRVDVLLALVLPISVIVHCWSGY